MQIAYWSNFHGQTGTTSNAIATAVNLAMKYNVKVLLSSIQYEKSNMDNAFFNKEELSERESGLDAIERVARTKDLDRNNFSVYTTSLIENRLDLITSSSRVSYELFKKINDSIKDILYSANKAYDFVFIDVNSGMKDEVTKTVLKESDIIVVNLSQNEKVIGDFFTKDKQELEELTSGKKIINIGNYDFKSKCSKKYISKVYKCNDEIFCTPYVTDFKDAINNHKAINYFMVNRNMDNAFFEEIDKISERLMIMNEKDLEILKDPVRKQTFSQRFKSILER